MTTYLSNESDYRLSEKQLRTKLESIYTVFDPEYVNKVCIVTELKIPDDRLFTECKTRKLDLVVRSHLNGHPIPIEYKRGKLTEEIVVECVFRRGYLELCQRHLPNFDRFLFVAEQIDPKAEALCKSLSDNSCEIKVVTYTYTAMAKAMMQRYVAWSKQNRSRVSTAKAITASAKLVPFWLGDNWVDAMLQELYGCSTSDSTSTN